MFDKHSKEVVGVAHLWMICQIYLCHLSDFKHMIHFLNDFQSGENHRNTIREAVKKCHKMWGLAQKINKYKVLAYMPKMKVENFLFEIYQNHGQYCLKAFKRD